MALGKSGEYRDVTFSLGPEKVQRVSKRQEKKVAKMVGGKRRPMSGASFKAKGDLDGFEGRMLAEHKYTEQQSISLKREWIEKISREALAEGRIPGMIVSWLGELEVSTPRVWIMVPLERLTEIVGG